MNALPFCLLIFLPTVFGIFIDDDKCNEKTTCISCSESKSCYWCHGPLFGQCLPYSWNSTVLNSTRLSNANYSFNAFDFTCMLGSKALSDEDCPVGSGAAASIPALSTGIVVTGLTGILLLLVLCCFTSKTVFSGFWKAKEKTKESQPLEKLWSLIAYCQNIVLIALVGNTMSPEYSSYAASFSWTMFLFPIDSFSSSPETNRDSPMGIFASKIDINSSDLFGASLVYTLVFQIFVYLFFTLLSLLRPAKKDIILSWRKSAHLRVALISFTNLTVFSVWEMSLAGNTITPIRKFLFFCAFCTFIVVFCFPMFSSFIVHQALLMGITGPDSHHLFDIHSNSLATDSLLPVDSLPDKRKLFQIAYGGLYTSFKDLCYNFKSRQLFKHFLICFVIGSSQSSPSSQVSFILVIQALWICFLFARDPFTNKGLSRLEKSSSILTFILFFHALFFIGPKETLEDTLDSQSSISWLVIAIHTIVVLVYIFAIFKSALLIIFGKSKKSQPDTEGESKTPVDQPDDSSSPVTAESSVPLTENSNLDDQPVEQDDKSSVRLSILDL